MLRKISLSDTSVVANPKCGPSKLFVLNLFSPVICRFFLLLFCSCLVDNLYTYCNLFFLREFSSVT